MSRVNRWMWRRSPELLSAVTVVGLATLAVLLPNRAEPDEAAGARQAEIAAAVQAAPYRIGRWVGVDVPIPPPATRLLHPNAILSRRFQPVEGRPGISILLVHCTDARDMRGHYPPVCYPYSGWSFAEDTLGREAVLEVRGRPIPVRVYRFRRVEADGTATGIRVFNVFILPDGTLTPDIDQINRLSDRLALAAQGVAQLQITTPTELADEDSKTAAAEILGGMSGLFSALGVWKEVNDG